MTSLTFSDRALDTIHEALSISGGSSLDIHSTQPSGSYFVSHLAYKYFMAGWVDITSIYDYNL